MTNPGDEWPKYLEIERWMEINLKRVRDLELDLGGRKRVLDIGCGTGYFLYINQYLGHDVLGLDLDEEPGFREMIELLGVKRKIWRIEAFQPLPDLGPKFDVIAAHMICFNGHKSDKLWKIAEWEFFLDDLTKHLTPGGQVCLELNREYDDSLYTPELKEYFEARGAEIHTQRVLFNPLRPAPSATAQLLAEVGFPLPMLLHDGRRRSVHERSVRELRLHGAQLVFEPARFPCRADRARPIRRHPR